MEITPRPAGFSRRLLHRWLIQYNPLYLLSAALCLCGMLLCSRGLANAGSANGELWVAAIAEIYAITLIGGAALLMRIGQRRSAVMLALITAFYQCDLTLHTEACACLGTVGAVAALAWLALFVAKMYALGWALRLRVTRGAAALAFSGALGLTALPFVLATVDGRTGTVIVALWAFGVLAFGVHGSHAVQSKVPLDAWGRTVLARSLRSVWLLWSALLVAHVVFWSTNHAIHRGALLPVGILLSTRWMRREGYVWTTVVFVLAATALALPSAFWWVALLAAASLVLRARWRPTTHVEPAAPQEPSPYRVYGASDRGRPSTSAIEPATPAARQRFFTGALFAVHAAAWTFGWSGGPWPLHAFPLDLALTALVAFAVIRARARIALAPLAATYAHFAIQARVVTAPQSILQWGATTVGVGFVLLVASLGASYGLRNGGGRGTKDGVA